LTKAPLPANMYSIDEPLMVQVLLTKLSPEMTIPQVLSVETPSHEASEATAAAMIAEKTFMFLF